MISSLLRLLVTLSILVAADVVLSSLGAADVMGAENTPGATFEDHQREDWIRSLEANRARIRAAEAKVAALQRRVTEARRRRYPRGEALAGLERELASSREELAEARLERPGLLEAARRAGVPPGSLRPFEAPAAPDTP